MAVVPYMCGWGDLSLYMTSCFFAKTTAILMDIDNSEG